MKIFLIGATGYIGSVVGEWLLKSKHSVTGLARSTNGCKRLMQMKIDPLFGSLDQPSAWVPFLQAFDAVVYCGYGYADPSFAKKEIAAGKSHLTEVLKALSGKTFVFTSGSGVFPDTGDVIYKEDTPFEPIDLPLNIARLNLEREVLAAGKSGVRSIVLRPPTVYGRCGSFMVPKTLLEHARAKGESILIEGCENKKWSAVHVEDLADLFVLALQKAKTGSLFNTASQSGITSASIAESISKAAGLGGKTKTISIAEARQIFGHWADWWALNNQCSGEKAVADLGWKPNRRSLLDDIENGSYVLAEARN